MDTGGKAQKSRSTFRMECAVGIRIRAPASRVWKLLTTAADMPRWNSTVTRIEGEIALGNRLALQVAAAPGRTFKPRVTAFEAERKMVWSDGAAPMFKGVRTFALESPDADTTVFSMIEVFSGIMLPMIKGSLPDFGPPFEQYAADLRSEAERN